MHTAQINTQTYSLTYAAKNVHKSQQSDFWLCLNNIFLMDVLMCNFPLSNVELVLCRWTSATISAVNICSKYLRMKLDGKIWIVMIVLLLDTRALKEAHYITPYSPISQTWKSWVETELLAMKCSWHKRAT